MVSEGNDDGVSDEDIVNLPYQSPKWIPRKPQAGPMGSPIKGKPPLKRSHFSTSVDK